MQTQTFKTHRHGMGNTNKYPKFRSKTSCWNLAGSHNHLIVYQAGIYSPQQMTLSYSCKT